MKSKVVNFVIPAMAIIFAVATSAFTVSQNRTTDDNNLITGYIPTPTNPCKDVVVECIVGGTFDCTYDTSTPVFQQWDGTMCQNRLSKPLL